MTVMYIIAQTAVIDCGVPPTTGNNSVVTYSDTSSGSRAMYSCTSDCYELDSDEDTLVCLSNESWSGHPPQCRCEFARTAVRKIYV